MCGIYMTNINYDKDNVVKKITSISFRGPDNLGFCKVNDVTLAHARLSIIDLDSRSNQPMQFQTLHIVYNGEVYNFLELKEELKVLGYKFVTTSDTEVLLIGYREWGAELIPKLNGMFAFCIYDTENQEIFCARDRLGVKPFYYYWKNGCFEISSQLQPLSQDKIISSEAVSIYLDCGYIPSPYSIFEDVYKLPPGNTMVINLNSSKISIKEYWNLQKVVLSDISYNDAKKQLHDLLKDSIKIRLHSDVPIGSFLSGGIDSALISAIASKVSDKQINTFSIAFDDPKYDESKVASEYAKILGSKHTTTICNPRDVIALIPKFVEVYDEPFADSSALPSLLLNSVTKPYVTVALTGDGGDESFIGYNHFDSVAKFVRFKRIPKAIRFIALKTFNFNYLKKKFSNFREILRIKTIDDFIEAIFIGYDSLQKIRTKNWLYNYKVYNTLSSNPIQKAADLNIKLWLENDSNVKVDRASMACSVETRCPMLDYRIVEFARTLPLSFRYEKNCRKKILRDILEEYIPEKVFNHPKKGFAIPLGSWIKNELKHEIISNLGDDFLLNVPNLNVPKFKCLLEQHLNSKRDNSVYIWRIYVLSKWYRKFGYFK
ncbi:MAG: asparagine synthase (glutamine-hydrolyzing) [Ginsengibacter sp.]